MHFENTQYGFEWGAIKIERDMSDNKKGWVQFCIQTPKHTREKRTCIDVYVTKTLKVRIFTEHKEVYTTPKKKGNNMLLKTKHYFACSFCGIEFETEIECRTHEQLEHGQQIEIPKVWAINGNIVTTTFSKSGEEK